MSLTLDEIEERLERLEKAVFLLSKSDKSTGIINEGMEFNINIRAFIKKYCNHNMSNPKKFTLLVAYLSGGICSKLVKISDIENSWNKMIPLMGGNAFNYAYSTRALEATWIDRGDTMGFYHLTNSWKTILKVKN